MQYRFETVRPEQIAAIDLLDEMVELNAGGTAYECARVQLADDFDEPETHRTCGAEALYIPSLGRGGVAWGPDAQWTDCDSMNDLLARRFDINHPAGMVE